MVIPSPCGDAGKPHRSNDEARAFRPAYQRSTVRGKTLCFWAVALVIFCAVCDVDSTSDEDSTAPTIPIPQGFTKEADGGMGENRPSDDASDVSKRRKSPTSAGPCSSGAEYEFKIVRRNNSDWAVCFELVNVAADWRTANSTCFERGGHLARPLSASDTQVIEDMLNSHPVSRDYWIDANDMNTEGQWRWTDGTPVGYVNWRPGRPIISPRHFSRDCAELHRNFKWQWNDKDCVDRKNYFMCQHRVRADAVPVTASSPPTSSSVRPPATTTTSSPSTSSTSADSSIVYTDSSDSSPTPTQSNPDSFTSTPQSALYPTTISDHASQPPDSDAAAAAAAAAAVDRDSGDLKPDPSSCPPASGVTPPPARVVHLLSPSQTALLVICIIAVLLMAFFASLVALPCLRRKLKMSVPSSSPSSPSSSIESQTDSSLNSSISLSSDTSSSQAPWAAVLKCFSSHPFHHQHQQSRPPHIHPYHSGNLPTVSLTAPTPNSRAPPRDVANRSTTVDASLSPTVDFLPVNPARLQVDRTSSFSTPDLLPTVEISPQLPAFSIKRKPSTPDEDEVNHDTLAPPPAAGTPQRRRPKWRLSLGSVGGGVGGSGGGSLGVSNPVYMADVPPQDSCVGEGTSSNITEGEMEPDDLRDESSPPPSLDGSKLELYLGEGTEEEPPSTSSQDDPSSQQSSSQKGLRLPMTTRNIFMKEVLGSREGGNSFKYEKF